VRYELTDYQREAAITVLQRLYWGGEDWRTREERSSFALSAITGAGKTVIATAAIEGMLFGSSDLEAAPDSRAAFL
jgi:superfamily II DNA or RNA helicase